MNEISAGIFLVIISGLMQGSYALFMKYMHPLKWENYWSIYATVSLFILPVILALFFINNFNDVLFSIPIKNQLLPLLFGGIWGIGNVFTGLSVVRIGLSLSFSIILGLTIVLGSLLPIFINNIPLKGSVLVFFIGGLLFIIIGTAISGYSGLIRDNNSLKKGMFIGLIFAVLSGIFSSMLNIAFVTGKNIALIAERSGSSSTNATFLVWVVVLFGGFLVNISYALYLLFKNSSFNSFKNLNRKNLSSAFISAVLWFGGFALFGMATVKMGNFGPSVGWAILLSLVIVVSNLWGIRFKEWENSKQALSFQLKSIFVTCIGIIFMAVSAFIQK